MVSLESISRHGLYLDIKDQMTECFLQTRIKEFQVVECDMPYSRYKKFILGGDPGKDHRGLGKRDREEEPLTRAHVCRKCIRTFPIQGPGSRAVDPLTPAHLHQC